MKGQKKEEEREKDKRDKCYLEGDIYILHIFPSRDNCQLSSCNVHVAELSSIVFHHT